MDGETHSHFTLCPFDADIRSQRAGGTPESCRLEVYAAYGSARNNLISRESLSSVQGEPGTQVPATGEPCRDHHRQNVILTPTGNGAI
jgi:hypothetical protein